MKGHLKNLELALIIEQNGNVTNVNMSGGRVYTRERRWGEDASLVRDNRLIVQVEIL
jgi:hypothetical protein|tara:strand:- start:9 stop:179 length:171 start_codon:yes stop_codon:yes gene_type:complete